MTMNDHSTFVRSATRAGIDFKIADLAVACKLMQTALATTDPDLALRTYNHATRTLTETHELLGRTSPSGEQRQQLTAAIGDLEEQLSAFRARQR
jgi:hypothetical protein